MTEGRRLKDRLLESGKRKRPALPRKADIISRRAISPHVAKRDQAMERPFWNLIEDIYERAK